MNKLNLQLSKLGKFAQGSRQLQLFVTGDSFLPPSQAEIKNAFLSDGWNILDVVVISPVISQFRGSKITITANVLNDYSDETVIQNARNIMLRFLTNVDVTIVKGKSLTANQILNSDSSDFIKGLGITTPIVIGLGVLITVLVLRK